MTRIKNTLEAFFILSGLECNVEKSVVMPVGLAIPVPEEIRTTGMGFEMAEKITVLGLILERNTEDFTESLNKMRA